MAGTGVGKFSSTGSNNTSNMTVNFAENMAPSNVNNAARELMGHMRDMYEQLGDGYFEFGDGDGTYTVARSDADTITITSSSDISGVYFAGRKIRITDGGANVVEGTIASSSHSSTTQTVNLTGISLASGTPTKVELGIDTAAFGGRVILDDDGDTYIEAPTDDTIDIYVAGAKDFVITANTFTAESGSTIAAQALTATGIAITNDGNIGSAGDADAIAISSSGVVTFSQAPVFPDGSIAVADLDIDGATDIGAAIVDADLFIIDDGAGGTNRKVTASRLKTYAGSDFGSAGTAKSIAGITFYAGQSGSIYTSDVSGTDDNAENNTAFGTSALDAITTGDNNIAFGEGALGANTTGSSNIAIGLDALDVPDTESNNLAIGSDALGGSIAGGEFNISIGNNTLDALTSGDNNTVMGYQAASGLTTGSQNIFIGQAAGGNSAVTGDDNVAIGKSAGANLTSGTKNVVMGRDAGGELNTGDRNVFVGDSAGDAATDAQYNAGVGNDALTSLTSGHSNTAVGLSALAALTTGDYNIAIGRSAADDFDTEDHNLAIGFAALGGAVAGGENNVAIGNYALDALTSGDENTAVGYEAGSDLSTGNDNVLIGMKAGFQMTTGSENVLIGHEAGKFNTFTGSTNTGVGTYALFKITSGSNNSALGMDAGSHMTTGSNNIMIGHDAGTSNSIAQTTTESNRIILGDANITDFFCADSSISSSDKRDKTDITDFSHGLNFIEQLQPKTYRWDKRVWYCEDHPTAEQVLAVTPDGSKKKNKLNVGFMAQDVQAIEEALGYKTDDETNLIFHKNDAMQVSLKYERLIPILVNAVKELSAEVKALKGE
ncbi:putative T4-like proximal tail fiber [uncultured Mediterranean phage uvMED]|nr:putative T4-like proximal tail fiber [uncultured Mediterranean phage uvMED]